MDIGDEIKKLQGYQSGNGGVDTVDLVCAMN